MLRRRRIFSIFRKEWSSHSNILFYPSLNKYIYLTKRLVSLMTQFETN